MRRGVDYVIDVNERTEFRLVRSDDLQTGVVEDHHRPEHDHHLG